MCKTGEEHCARAATMVKTLLEAFELQQQQFAEVALHDVIDPLCLVKVVFCSMSSSQLVMYYYYIVLRKAWHKR